MIDNLTLRIYFFLCMLLSAFPAWAQRGDDGYDDAQRGGADISEIFNMDEGADYHPFNLGVTDVLLVALVIAACYVFGKIWRGCSYLIIIFAALMFYLTRY